MAINKNHEFEELDGVKCAIVERNVPQQRVDFLKDLLETNNYTVVVVASPPPKAAPAPAPAAENQPPAVEPAPAPATFTVGVTDVTFNPTNAIFGRLLKTRDKHIVTLAYWKQKEPVPMDEVPYFEDRNS
ncbi:MAG TPA: hypothetical protein VJ499_03455 [Flavisolibacter sp.]|nr:hypothetical protein [Flavisolibacter sp.]